MPVIPITSKDNPKIKQVRSLRQRSHRQAAGLFVVEGIRHVGEAAEAASQGGAGIDSLFFAPDLLTSLFARDLVEQQAEAGVPCYSVPADLFNTLADKENPQGILALVRRPSIALEDLNSSSFPWAVALVSPQDPGNIGSILRTIDAVGASGLLLLDSPADPHHPAAVRASMGALFWYPVVQATFEQFITWTGREGYTIYGTSARGSIDFRAVQNYQFPLVLLMGSEREGLSPEQLTACHQLIRLPMQGRATSLNLAVAAGVFLYEILTRTDAGLPPG